MNRVNEYGGITGGGRVDVREMPYVRQIAEHMCEDPNDKDELQRKLWQIDAMAYADVRKVYEGMVAGTAGNN